MGDRRLNCGENSQAEEKAIACSLSLACPVGIIAILRGNQHFRAMVLSGRKSGDLRFEPDVDAPLYSDFPQEPV
jgi:hypothetical protein